MQTDKPTKNYFEPADTPEERVKKGAELLDSIKPKWWTFVEDRIIMDSCDYCILGQVFGAFGAGIINITAVYSFDFNSFYLEGVIAYGFDVGQRLTSSHDYIELEKLWWTEINKRRNDATKNN